MQWQEQQYLNTGAHCVNVGKTPRYLSHNMLYVALNSEPCDMEKSDTYSMVILCFYSSDNERRAPGAAG